MKKIMFNDRYGLTQAVLEGRKTQTRRILYPTMLFRRMKTFEGWSEEDIGSWKASCMKRLYAAQGEELQQMLDCALQHSRYKLGETIAIAQKYEDLIKDDEFYRLLAFTECPWSASNTRKDAPTRSSSVLTLCPITSASPASASNVCKISATRTVWKKEFGHEPEDGIVMTS